MRHYAVDDEVRVAVGQIVHEWTASGLLSPVEAQALASDLTTPLRRTSAMLRLGLAAFTVVAGGAAVAFVAVVTDLDEELAVALTAGVLGVTALAAASLLAGRYRWYRHGVEEALALGAVGLFGAGAGLLGAEVVDTSSGAPWAVAMVAVAAAAGHVYRRFGFQYAAVIALCAAALLPMAFRPIDVEPKRLFAALVFAAGYAMATRGGRRADDDVRRGDAAVVRAAAVAGAYIALHPFLLGEWSNGHLSGWYRWVSWSITWAIPVVVGRTAIVERDPLLLRVAMASGLASLVTNKSYFGWVRHPWDPMVLGIALVALALVLRRWLSAGPSGERNGFTSRPLVTSEGAMIELASLAAVTVPPTQVREIHEATDPRFSGGRSGGAGGGAQF